MDAVRTARVDGRARPPAGPSRPGDVPRRGLRGHGRHDLVDAAGFLVLGAIAAAALTVVVPESWTRGLAGSVVLAVAVLAVLAVVLALCSEADAFVAASLSALPLLPRLVFLVALTSALAAGLAVFGGAG